MKMVARLNSTMEHLGNSRTYRTAGTTTFYNPNTGVASTYNNTATDDWTEYQISLTCKNNSSIDIYCQLLDGSACIKGNSIGKLASRPSSDSITTVATHYSIIHYYVENELDYQDQASKQSIALEIPLKSPVARLARTRVVDKKCFVLTACYGNEDDPVVQDFRSFRDNYLTKNKFGRLFIKWYYKHGAKIARHISEKPLTKNGLRKCFNCIRVLLPK